uniref:Uncharacterized protein n=1 Tax=Globodera rostochiensis TaxID=31243 RepID=A0A914HT80_GLORO
MPEFLSDTENEDDEMDDELENAAEGESEEESAEETEEAATDGSENEEVHERGREWKDARKAIKLRSFARKNSPFARDIEFVLILKRPQFQNGDITIETILALHKAVMEADGQNEAAGQLRTCNVRVGKFNPMDYTRVPGAMNLFIEWLRVQMAAGHMSAGERKRTHVQASMNMILTRRHFNPVEVPEEKRQIRNKTANTHLLYAQVFQLYVPGLREN